MLIYPGPDNITRSDDDLNTEDLGFKITRLHNPWLTPQQIAEQTGLQGQESQINFLVSHYDYPFQRKTKNGITKYRLIDANQFRKRRRSRCA